MMHPELIGGGFDDSFRAALALGGCALGAVGATLGGWAALGRRQMARSSEQVRGALARVDVAAAAVELAAWTIAKGSGARTAEQLRQDAALLERLEREVLQLTDAADQAAASAFGRLDVRTLHDLSVACRRGEITRQAYARKRRAVYASAGLIADGRRA